MNTIGMFVIFVPPKLYPPWLTPYYAEKSVKVVQCKRMDRVDNQCPDVNAIKAISIK